MYANIKVQYKTYRQHPLILTRENMPDVLKIPLLLLVFFWSIKCSFRAIFKRPWNENARKKQKQQNNGNRAIWLVYRTDTNARGFWLVKRTIWWKDFTPENFLEINRYFGLTSYCNTIGQSNNAFSILGLIVFFGGKRRVHVLIFSSIAPSYTILPSVDNSNHGLSA